MALAEAHPAQRRGESEGHGLAAFPRQVSILGVSILGVPALRERVSLLTASPTRFPPRSAAARRRWPRNAHRQARRKVGVPLVLFW